MKKNTNKLLLVGVGLLSMVQLNAMRPVNAFAQRVAPGMVRRPVMAVSQANVAAVAAMSGMINQQRFCSDNNNLVSTDVASDGTIVEKFKNYSKRTNLDGSVIEEHKSGILVVKCSDGSELSIVPGSAKTLTRPDGTSKTTWVSGEVIERYLDGSSKIISPNGYIQEEYKNGAIKFIKPDGTIAYESKGEVGKYTLPNGDVREIFEDGAIQDTTPGGLIQTTYKDGSAKVIRPDGFIFEKDKDGRVKETSPDGTVRTY